MGLDFSVVFHWMIKCKNSGPTSTVQWLELVVVENLVGVGLKKVEKVRDVQMAEEHLVGEEVEAVPLKEMLVQLLL